ncbi:sulfite exporter TauE/SafE family protein [Streptomyces sp. NPDC048659]|uniref:urease accessory protein UreH domain-containing protein n=1 Tax=Streptomyces sp. NPDC048659 TaxID=3155489 RepID=UPI00343DC6E5
MTPPRTAIAAAGLLAALGCPTAAAAAPAHPLGNFTVNYHTGLVMRPDGIDATIVVDRAEIAALQERPAIDTDHDNIVTDAETSRYSRTRCAALAGQLHLRTAAGPARWNPKAAVLTWERGEAGLKTSRLTCTYSAPAALRHGGDITARTAYDTTRIGWHEITVKGIGLRITGTTLPATSPTGELRHYPADPLAAPLDQRTAELHAAPAPDTAADTVPATGTPVGQATDRVAGWFDSLIARRELTVPVGLLALLLALVLGASHALLPGHGKTIMAASLAGRRGTRRDAVTVGATVTLTHTAGVLVLGLALPAATHLAGETVLTWLGGASGLIVTAIGLWLLTAALRDKPAHGHHHHHHHAGHHHQDHDHDHDHDRGHAHDHDDGQGHRPPARTSASGRPPAGLPGARDSEAHTPAPSGAGAVITRAMPEPTTLAGRHHTHGGGRDRQRSTGLIGLGIAGGLVPSPSALVVLLGAVALGRTAFGVLLVIAYGLGMATTLTLAGLLLLHVKHRLHTRLRTHRARHLVRRLARLGPVGTSVLVVLVGLGLTLRAATA